MTDELLTAVERAIEGGAIDDLVDVWWRTPFHEMGGVSSDVEGFVERLTGERVDLRGLNLHDHDAPRGEALKRIREALLRRRRAVDPDGVAWGSRRRP